MKDTSADFRRIEATIPDDFWMGDVFVFSSFLFFLESEKYLCRHVFYYTERQTGLNILNSLLNFREKVQTTGIACLKKSCFQRFANVVIQHADLPTTTSSQ